jgi:6-methylsalicylate decarboxylase
MNSRNLIDLLQYDSRMRVDAHQHVWTQPLLDALAARQSLPCIARSDGLTVLHCAGELPYVIDVESEAPARRVRLLSTDGVDQALIALASPIGIEALARESTTELIKAHLDGVDALGNGFAAWGPVALDRPDPDDVDRVLGRGCVGVSLPAGALAGPEALAAFGPLLARTADRRVPVFVHPGHAPCQRAPDASLTEPLWWQPLTRYVAQMQAAWLTFATLGRREHPELVVLFAMLAGGAPLLSERLASRGGPAVDVRDPGVFYDTSSFGATAINAMVRRVGEAQLVYGSDRPVVDPVPSGREISLQANAARLISTVASAA